MTSLIAPPPNNDPQGASVAADGWYPPVTLESVRGTIRLGGGVVTTGRLTAAIQGAMFDAMRALESWRARREAEGAQALAEVTSATLAGENRAELLWSRVIRFYAASELAENHRDVSATEDGLDRQDNRSDMADDYRRRAYEAIADLLSLGESERAPRNRVSLL